MWKLELITECHSSPSGASEWKWLQRGLAPLSETSRASASSASDPEPTDPPWTLRPAETASSSQPPGLTSSARSGSAFCPLNATRDLFVKIHALFTLWICKCLSVSPKVHVASSPTVDPNSFPYEINLNLTLRSSWQCALASCPSVGRHTWQ